MNFVYMDMAGGTMACIQICSDYFFYGNGTGFFKELNYGKLGLNFLSVLFSTVFLYQHFITYT